MPKKNVTNDELARLVAHGFEDTTKRLDDIDGRLGAIESRLDRVHGDQIEIRNVILKDYGRRIERLESALAVPNAR